MTALASTAARAISAVRGESRFQIFDRISSTLHASQAEIEEISFRSLQKILIHAYDTTVFYRNSMQQAGIDPLRIQNPDQISSLAEVTKDDIRSRRDEFFSSAADRRQCETKSTSGSSGEPLTFIRDKTYYEFGAAGTMRNMALAGWCPGDSVAVLWGYERDVEDVKGRLKSSISRKYLLNAFRQTPATMAAWVELIHKQKIRFIYGYPSSLHMFAQFVQQQGVELSFQAAFCTAEKYFPFERQLVESVFGCKSYDLYGSSEIQNIAFECTHGNMHVSSDFALVQESQRRSGPPRLVTTAFHNFCLPFIRYDLGDYGCLLPNPCPCGIHMPLLELYGGSKYDFLLTDSGMIHGAVLERIFNKIPGIARYQIVQHSTDRYTVRTEISSSGRDAIMQEVERSARQVLEKVIGHDVSIKFEFLDHLAAGANGKFRFVYRE